MIIRASAENLVAAGPLAHLTTLSRDEIVSATQRWSQPTSVYLIDDWR
jgi:hypothetical protein